MKQDLNRFSIPGMEELTLAECEFVNGGESAWYWVGYVVGAFVKAVTTGGPTTGQKVYNMALS